jgi:hypothetical protein
VEFGHEGWSNSTRTLVAATCGTADASTGAESGAKIFVHSPYDCVVAVKRDLADRLSWLDSHGQYERKGILGRVEFGHEGWSNSTRTLVAATCGTADASTAPGAKIFVHSPYDCVVAVKRDLADRLSWLDSHGLRAVDKDFGTRST